MQQMPSEMTALVAAAHELKSPLTLMHHLAHSLRDSDVALTPAERDQYLLRLQLTSERMLRLVQQFALSCRINDERQLAFVFELEPLSMQAVCETALHEMTPLAHEYGQNLRFKGRQCPHLVLANREVLHDIVVNLVDNAIRHNIGGSTIEVAGACRGNQVRLGVHDDGLPVRPGELKHLKRTIGEQLQPLSGRSGTSGMGLYIVQQLAQAMGGRLGVAEAGQGTTFFVDLLRSHQLHLLP